MIDEIETYKRFGYYSTDLMPHSGKKIVVRCDKCGKIRILRKTDYRDLCKSCAAKSSVLAVERLREMINANIGTHLTDKHKAKISNANKGKEFSEEHRRNIGKTSKGREHTEEARNKMSVARKGKKVSEEARKNIGDARRDPVQVEKMRIRMTGERNPRWKGGSSFAPYCYKFDFALREKIREKYGRKCYFCGKTEEENRRKLDVHHIDQDKEQGCNGKHWFLIPLCCECHSKLHAMENKKKREKRKKKKEKICNKVLYLQKSLL